MTAVRPRFSLRWVMIAFTLLGAASYFLFVRPTVLANRFVESIQRGDFTQAELLLGGAITVPTFNTVASAYPRDWSDIWHCRRTIEVSSFSSSRFPNGASGNNLDRFLAGASDVKPARGLPHDAPYMSGSAAYQAGPFGIRLIRSTFPPSSQEESLSIDQ